LGRKKLVTKSYYPALGEVEEFILFSNLDTFNKIFRFKSCNFQTGGQAYSPTPLSLNCLIYVRADSKSAKIRFYAPLTENDF